MIKINIGCGRDYREGWLNTDISKEVKADVYLDIRKDKLPFKNGEVEEIYISGVLEQILKNEDLIFAMNECHRVLKSGGIINIVVPNGGFKISVRDPMDCRKFIPETFQYFHYESRYYKLYGSVYGFFAWDVLLINTNSNKIMEIKMKKYVS